MILFFSLIGVIVVLVLAKFFVFLIRQNYVMKKAGGIETKYAEIVIWVQQTYPGAVIYHRKNTSLGIGVQRMASSSSFLFTKTYLHLQVNFRETNSLIGTIELEWSFPEDMPQAVMISTMELDIKKKQCGLG